MYRPTTYKYVGPTETLYLVYEKSQKYRGGKIHTRTFVKRFYVSGKVRSTSGPSTYKNRRGKKVFGMRIIYVTKVRGGGRAHAIKSMTVTKIVPVPRGARNVRIVKTPPKGPLMAVD